jgi:hypothetical protein
VRDQPLRRGGEGSNLPGAIDPTRPRVTASIWLRRGVDDKADWKMSAGSQRAAWQLRAERFTQTQVRTIVATGLASPACDHQRPLEIVAVWASWGGLGPRIPRRGWIQTSGGSSTASYRQDPPGTFGAHHLASCPKTLRTAEISAADQTACEVCPAWSETPLHKTRPTGRLTPHPWHRPAAQQRLLVIPGTFRAHLPWPD